MSVNAHEMGGSVSVISNCPSSAEAHHAARAHRCPSTLRRMTAREFLVWRADLIRYYAADISHATGLLPEAALEASQRQFAELLPGGLETEDHCLMKVLDSTGLAIGTLWIGPHTELPGVAYVYQINIDRSARGRGYGRAAMAAAEHLASEIGFTELSLNVFGFNERARRLYDSMDYRVVAVQMTKALTLDPVAFGIAARA